MSKKRTLKIMIDCLMTVLLLLLMARQITGDLAHEWMGAGIMVLWVAHHLLNRSWYSHMLKGRYTPVRVLQMVVNIALFFAMLGLMISGIILSREVFAFLPISGGIAFARTLHTVAAYWGFTLMSLHLGLHWNMVIGMAKKAVKEPDAIYRWVLRIVAALNAGYGIYAFFKRDIGSYMLLRNQFVFFDFEEPFALFFVDYMAIMGMFVCASHYFSAILRKKREGGQRP